MALQRAAYACAHRIVANADAAADRLRREQISTRRIAVVRNGLDVARFTPFAQRPSGHRRCPHFEKIEDYQLGRSLTRELADPTFRGVQPQLQRIERQGIAD